MSGTHDGLMLPLSHELSLPIDVVTQRLAWLGRTGSGKTYGAMKLAELMLDAGAQIIVFDIPGHWSGLRLGSKPFSIPVLGGLRGDIPLEPTAGAAVADLVVDRGISVVLDVSQMEDPELWEFSADFTSRLFQRKLTAPSAVHVFYDECQELVPQELERGQKRVFQAIHRQQKRGRTLGIGTSMISQRPQEVNKRVLNQAECLFAFQMTGSLERAAIGDWVATRGLEKANIVRALPKLPVGTAHVWSPQWLDISKEVKIAKKRTPDVSATPKVGDRKAAPRELSPVDLRDLRASMVATIERAIADDPRALRSRIAELEQALRAKPSVAPPPKIVEVEKPILTPADRKELVRMADAAEKLANRARELLVALATKQQSAPSHVPRERPLPAIAEHAPPKLPTRATGARSNGAGQGMGDGERKILIATAQHADGVTREQLSIITGYKRSTRDTYVQRLRAKDFISDGGSGFVATDAGVQALGADYEPLPTGSALLQYWLERLPEGERVLLDLVTSQYPKAVARDAISELSQYKRSTRDTYLQRLSARRLIAARRDGVVASSELFD